MARNGKTSPWVYVALGCLGAAVVAILVVAGLGFAGWRWARGLEEQVKDPASRTAKVLEVLGGERVPDGYHAVIALEIPFLMKMAILSDVPPTPAGDPGQWSADRGFEERGLIFFEMPSWGNEGKNLDDFIEGRTDDAEFLRRSSIDLHRGEVIARGEVALPGAERARYVAQRGSIGGEGGGGEGVEGLTSTVLVECAGDTRIRLALWFGPDPDPAAAPAALERSGTLAGTVADPEAMAAFLGQFRFCG
jgi:hypothetical protein